MGFAKQNSPEEQNLCEIIMKGIGLLLTVILQFIQV